MTLSIKVIPQFTHKCPDGMFYEVEEFKKNVLSIWISYKEKFDYNLGKPVKCIWGFYSLKDSKFYAPVNSKTIGKEVKFSDTRTWTSMQLKQSILEKFFV